MNKYKSSAMASVHEIANDLLEVGLIDDNKMSEFNTLCLKKKLRWCNDYCVENPLQYFDEVEGFFGYDVLEGIEEYLNFIIPEDIKTRILNQEEEWEKFYDNTPPEYPNDEGVIRIRDLAISILKDLRNILPEEVEVYLCDEVLQDEVLIK